MKEMIFVCSFSAGLDEMPRALQANAVAVLAVLKKAGRFSVFEATANDTIARMMTRLCYKGYSTVRDGVRTDYGRLIETDNSCGYPWTKVKLTPAGERLLSESTPTEPPKKQP